MIIPRQRKLSVCVLLLIEILRFTRYLNQNSGWEGGLTPLVLITDAASQGSANCQFAFSLGPKTFKVQSSTFRLPARGSVNCQFAFVVTWPWILRMRTCNHSFTLLRRKIRQR